MIVMVTVKPAMPALSQADRLRERYRITAREAEVAALLALGSSNREI